MNKDKMLDELSVLQERFANGMGWRDGEYEEALDEAIELIDEMPDIVRCKDCKFYHNELANSPKRGTYLCERLRAYTEKDDFCCWGKTK